MHLKQSTASQSVLIGPFVDTDGAAVTGLTIDAADIRLSKNGANIVGKNSGGGTHDELGYYTITLDATDTDTVGRLQLACVEAGALAVYHEFEVLEEAVYDALYGASALGYVANAPVNVAQISGDSGAADNLENSFDDTAGPVPWLGIVDQGTAQSATATTLVGRAAGAFANDTLIGCVLMALGSTQGYWQARIITDVDLATDTFTVDTWTVTPSGTITYKIIAAAPSSSSLPIPVNVTQFGGASGTFSGGRPEVKVSSFEAGSLTASVFATDALGADALAADAVTEIQSGLATAAAVADLPTNAELATALAAADDAVLAAIAALENLSAAEVNAQVVDALATDTYAEPGQGSPAATATLAVKLGYLYKAWRNRSTQTATEYALYADDGTTKDHEAACSDDATTFVRGEVATGA